jgi:hypothetical protein
MNRRDKEYYKDRIIVASGFKLLLSSGRKIRMPGHSTFKMNKGEAVIEVLEFYPHEDKFQYGGAVGYDEFELE